MSVNKVTLLGRLGRDPEVRQTQSGAKIVSFSVATAERWRDKQSGERKERTEWHQVVIFNEGLGQIAEQYLKKGSEVYLEGQMATRKWQDQSGQERYTTEVVLRQYRGELSLVGGQGNGRPAPSEGDYGTTKPAGGTSSTSQTSTYSADLDDDIPF
jgi:single-strand DNA-binding protein